MVLYLTKPISKRLLSLFLVSLISLAAAPVAGEDIAGDGRQPYLVEHEQIGMIGCSAAYMFIQGKDFCGGFNANTKSIFEFPLDARLTTLVLQVENEGGVIEAEEFAISFTKPVGIPGVRGPLPILATYTFDEDDAWPEWDTDGQELVVDLRPSHDALLPQVSYEQRLRVCVGLFHNGADVPDGYTACPDL